MENVNVPYNTKTISSCLECPYHKMYPLSRKKKKIICTQTNEEVEVKDIEYFSIMSMCPYKQKASTENEIAKLSMFIENMNDKSLIEKAYQRVWDLYNVKVTTQTYIDNYIVRQ